MFLKKHNYKIPVNFIFTGWVTVEAKNLKQAVNIVQDHFAMVNANLLKFENTSDERINYEFDITPKKEILLQPDDFEVGRIYEDLDITNYLSDCDLFDMDVIIKKEKNKITLKNCHTNTSFEFSKNDDYYKCINIIKGLL